MSEKLVSVIMACYNGEEFLGEAIESVFGQSYGNIEVVVVDDGSTDNSASIIKSYDKVRYVRQENSGVAAARNTGLGLITGDYVVVHDVDDRLLPDAFRVGVDALGSHGDCGFVYGRNFTIDEEGKRFGEASRRQTVVASYESLLSGIAFVPPSCAMFRREAFDVAGGFDSGCVPADDYDIYLRVAREFAIYCHNEIVVEYRKHRGNQSKTNMPLFGTLHVLDKQKAFIKGNSNLEAAYKTSRRKWQRLFGRHLLFPTIRHLRAGRFGAAVKSLGAFRFAPQGLYLAPLEVIKRVGGCFRGRQGSG